MEVLELVARGGFGRVERVRLHDGTLVARKVFEPDAELAGMDQGKLRRRFVYEVEAQRRLAPYGVMPVLAADLQADPPWYTMPLATKSFRAQVGEDRAAGVVSTQPLVDILNALEEVHRLGYVHRDLKPENVLLCDGVWRLADFGLVAIPQSDDATRVTSTAASWATVGYCAPEQAVDFKHADRAVDIYAFGCILHDIVGTKARIPFQTHTAKGPLGGIVSRCTQVDPRQRFKSVGALRSALLDALARAARPLPEGEAALAWRDALARIHEWDANKLDELVAHLEEHATDVCSALDEERLVELHGVDPLAWRAVALAYCAYAAGAGGPFPFAYCDVVAACLLEIFDLGDVEIRAAAAMSLAMLGSTHNRWSALRKLLTLCGPGLDGDVAERLALDIRATEREATFRACAAAVAKPVTVFHPRIVAAVQSSEDIAASNPIGGSERRITVREGRRKTES
jgi:hypothetical protein